MRSAGEDRPVNNPRIFRVGAVVGLGIVAIALYGLIRSSSDTNPTGFAKLFLGLNLVSDAVFLPLAVALGTLLARLAPARLRPVVQAGLLATGMVSLFALPFVLGFGRIEESPSVLPRNYAQGLLGVLGVIWAVAAVVALAVVVRTRASSVQGDLSEPAAGPGP